MSFALQIDLFSPLLYLALLPVIYLLRQPFLRFITPRGIPGIPALPTPAPLIGDLPWLAKAWKTTGGMTRIMDAAAKQLGPIAQIRISFLYTLVIVTDYQETESILQVRHADFDRAEANARFFRQLLPTGQISQITGPMWKHHRRIIGPAMTSKHLSLTTPRANEAVMNLIELFKLKASKAGGRSFESEGDMTSATMDAICGMAFGSSWHILGGIKEQIQMLESAPTGHLGDAVFRTTRPDIADATWYIFEAVPITVPFPAIIDFFTSLSPTYRRHSRTVRSYLKSRLDESREKIKAIGSEAAMDLVDNTLDMMVARESRAEDWMPDNEMIDEVLQYLVAGTETSGATLTWFLKYMTNSPSIQRKLRDHIIARKPQLQDRQPTFEDLNAATLPYLEAVVYETLRLSRTAGGYAREAKKDVTVLGHRIPKGTTVVFTTATGTEDLSTPTAAPYLPNAAPAGTDALIRQTEALADVRYDPSAARKIGYWAAGTGHLFDPERWMTSKGEFDPYAGPSMPFGLGQRGCFGKNLAVLEMRLFMAQLSLAFFFGPVPETMNSTEFFETVANHPRQSYIRPMSWECAEAQAQVLA